MFKCPEELNVQEGSVMKGVQCPRVLEPQKVGWLRGLISKKAKTLLALLSRQVKWKLNFYRTVWKKLWCKQLIIKTDEGVSFRWRLILAQYIINVSSLLLLVSLENFSYIVFQNIDISVNNSSNINSKYYGGIIPNIWMVGHEACSDHASLNNSAFRKLSMIYIVAW